MKGIVRRGVSFAEVAALLVLAAGVVAVVGFAVVAERTLAVLPVSVPGDFVEAGYSPSAASQAVAAHMATVAGLSGRAPREGLAVGRPPGGSPSFDMVASGAPDLLDIRVPGQPFSFRAVSRFMRDVIGAGDPTVSVSVANSGAHHVVRATAVGGVYAGRRETAMVRRGIAREDVMRTAAALAVGVVQPLRYAAFLAETSGSRDQDNCPAGLTCTSDVALSFVGELLADDYVADDALAHLVYAFIAFRSNAINEALQHCEAATASKHTREWGLIYCAHSQLSVGKKDRALMTALSGLPVRSTEPDVYAAFGDLFLALEALGPAQRSYERALALDGRHVYSLIGLGTVARRNRQFAKAAGRYRSALLINPYEAYALGGLGACLARLGEPEEALFYLDRALCIDESFQIAVDARNEVLRTLGRTGEAARLTCDPVRDGLGRQMRGD